jgi:DNA-binding transcriptional ArsR family regulator
MRQFMEIASALGDESRVRLLMALGNREICVQHLVELLGLAPSTVSKHLSLLRHAGLVEQRKQGRWIFYRRADANAPAAVRNTYSYLQHCVGLKPEIKADYARLAEIIERDVDS